MTCKDSLSNFKFSWKVAVNYESLQKERYCQIWIQNMWYNTFFHI